MAEEDYSENEERIEEKAPSRFPWMEKALIEMLRLLFFSLVAFVIIYFVSIRKEKESDLGELQRIDRQFENIPEPRPVGAEWNMDEMIINTADELANHFVKINVVISYSQKDLKVASALSARRSEIHSEVRKIVGSKFYIDLKSVEKQALLGEEIKTRVQQLVGIPGILEVYITDFTIH